MLTPHTFLDTLAAWFDSDTFIGYLPFLLDKLLLTSHTSSLQQDLKPCQGKKMSTDFSAVLSSGSCSPALICH